MAIKNYYVVLGVHREVSDAGIRSAYKDLAKQFHPDRIGEHSTEAFQAISEAYQTLSDPEKRRLHNRLLDRSRIRKRVKKTLDETSSQNLSAGKESQ